MPLISTYGNAASQAFGSLGIQTGGSAQQTAAAYLQFPAGVPFRYDTGNFTIEMWFYPTNAGSKVLWHQASAGVNATSILIYTRTTRQVFLQVQESNSYVFTQNQFQLNQWNHLALVRSSNNIRFYLNGFGSPARFLSRNFNSNTVIPRLGFSFQSLGFIGNFSNVRVAKSAYYTSNFEPSLLPFTRTSQGASAVQLLLNFQNNQRLLVDSSVNNITVSNFNGTVFSELSPYKVPFVIPPTIAALSATVTPNTFSIAEGSTITFTVSGTNTPNGTYYWSIEPNDTTTTLTASDFQENSLTGSFTINNNVGTVDITPVKDLTTEGPEIFSLFVRTESSSGLVIGTSDEITIIDTSITPVFTATPGSINEGSSGIFTVANVGANGTYFFTVENITTTNADFVAANGSFTVSGSTGGIDNGTGSFAITPTLDRTTEGPETFRVQIRSGSTSGPIIITSANVTVNDVSLTPAFTATPASINEGASGSFTVNNLGPAGTYFFTVLNGTTANADFAAVSGSFTTSTLNGNGSFTITPVLDYVTEGSETFQVQIRTGSIGGPVILTSTSVTVNDTSTTISAVASPNFISAGDATTVSVSAAAIPAGTYYWTVQNLSTTDFDFDSVSGAFTVIANSGSFDVVTQTLAGQGEFNVQIRTGSPSGIVRATTNTVFITASDDALP